MEENEEEGERGRGEGRERRTVMGEIVGPFGISVEALRVSSEH